MSFLSIKKRIKKLIGLLEFIMKVIFWSSIPFDTDKPVAFVFKVSKWKQPYITSFLHEYKVIYVPYDGYLFLLEKVIKTIKIKVFVVWGVKDDHNIVHYSNERNIPLYRIEDGFIRSVGLGAMLTPPFSICLDKKGMYFDSTYPSDLEDLLNNYDFKEDPQLLDYAKKCMDYIINQGISKYNHVKKKDSEHIYGKKSKPRILVIGQVEDDASILRGCNRKITNNDLVRLAQSENPGCEIIYKPHPDVLSGVRKMQSNPEDVKGIAKVVYEPLSLIDSFRTIDHVYTITSLSGFEALLRGLKVTTVGAPFYSGWGLTDDRQSTSRRTKKRTIEELFAAAYILYPRYVDPYTKEEIDLLETLKRLNKHL